MALIKARRTAGHTTEVVMVYAVQIWIHRSWNTVAVYNDAGRAEVNTQKASKELDCDTRVEKFASATDAWKQ